MKSSRRNRGPTMAVLIMTLLLCIVQGSGPGKWSSPGTAEAKLIGGTTASAESLVALDKSNPAVKTVMGAQKRHSVMLMETPGVIGTATGLDDQNKPAIIVFSERELEAGTMPESLEGIPVKVKVTGKIYALRDTEAVSAATQINPTEKLAFPVQIGVSTGNSGECSVGTIGARLKDGAGNVYALSNNHIYALENSAPIGSAILQPGRYDTGCGIDNNNVIGSLANYVRIDFSGQPNRVDAAIAASSPRKLRKGTPPDGYGKPNSLTYTQVTGRSPRIGQSVKKYGRTTRLTVGYITGINVVATVCYDSSCSRIAHFVDQIAIGYEGFSGAGDSGSLIVTNNNRELAVGLLFAAGSGVTLANPIDAVLSSFGLTIDGK